MITTEPDRFNRCLIDTNVLLRFGAGSGPGSDSALHTIDVLLAREAILCVTPQNIAEFWNAATRPAQYNGFGYSTLQAQAAVLELESIFTVLADSEKTYAKWREIVVKYKIQGKQAHDARLAASMSVHDISWIVTYNAADFARFEFCKVIDPSKYSGYTA